MMINFFGFPIQQQLKPLNNKKTPLNKKMQDLTF